MYCGECGAKSAGSKFCQICGHKLKQEQVTHAQQIIRTHEPQQIPPPSNDIMIIPSSSGGAMAVKFVIGLIVAIIVVGVGALALSFAVHQIENRGQNTGGGGIQNPLYVNITWSHIDVRANNRTTRFEIIVTPTVDIRDLSFDIVATNRSGNVVFRRNERITFANRGQDYNFEVGLFEINLLSSLSGVTMSFENLSGRRRVI